MPQNEPGLSGTLSGNALVVTKKVAPAKKSVGLVKPKFKSMRARGGRAHHLASCPERSQAWLAAERRGDSQLNNVYCQAGETAATALSLSLY